MFSDILITSYIATILWCFSDYFYWIMLWLPPYYGYHTWKKMQQYLSLAQAGAKYQIVY